MYYNCAILVLCTSLYYLPSCCDSYLLTLQRLAHRSTALQSDFMGDIAREKVTLKSLAKFDADGRKQDEFTPPSNFERDEFLRALSDINEKNVSWFQLTPFAQRRYAKSVMCLLDSPSALDIVSSKGDASLGSALEGLWRLALSNEDIYKSWTKGIQVFINIRATNTKKFDIEEETENGKSGSQGVFEQITQLPIPAGSFIPSRIRQAGSLVQNKLDGSIEYYFEKVLITWLGREWLLPIRFDASPSGYLGVSYMDGKVWLDVKDLTGLTTRDSAAASKFSALTYISDCKQEVDWSSF